MNRPAWDMYPDSWRAGPQDEPEEPANFCQLCGYPTPNRILCDPCADHLDNSEEDEEVEPDYP